MSFCAYVVPSAQSSSTYSVQAGEDIAFQRGSDGPPLVLTWVAICLFSFAKQLRDFVVAVGERRRLDDLVAEGLQAADEIAEVIRVFDPLLMGDLGREGDRVRGAAYGVRHIVGAVRAGLEQVAL